MSHPTANVAKMTSRVNKLTTALDNATRARDLKELAHVMAGTGDVVKAVRQWYQYHEAGLLGQVADALHASAGSIRLLAQESNTSPKLAAVLGQFIGVQAEFERQLRATMATYDHALRLPKKLQDVLPHWFATHLPDPAPLECYHLLYRMGEGTEFSVDLFYTRLKGKKKPLDPVDHVDEIVAAVTGAKLIGQFVKKGLLDFSLAKACVVLSEEEFNHKYVKDFFTRNEKLVTGPSGSPFWRVLPVSEVDNVSAYCEHEMIYLRTDWSLSDGVHEVMHLLSERLTGSRWKTDLGMVLEEAAAEYLCRRICAEQGIEFTLDGYYNNVTLLETIMKLADLSDLVLADAYFNGNTEPVVSAIRTLSGDQGLDILRNSKDRMGYDTYYAWMAAHHDVSQDCPTCCTIL